MFKNLLVVFVFLCQFRGYAFRHTQGDTSKEHIIGGYKTLILPISQNVSAKSSREVAETKDKTPMVINMHGHNIYHVGQQTVLMFNGQELKRLFPDKHDNDTINNDNDESVKMKKMMTLIAQGYRLTSEFGAHKLHLKKMSWNQARQTCIQEGGHLAIINSESEKKGLVHMLQWYNIDHAWIGIHDLFEEGEWITVIGDSFVPTEYIKWATNDIWKWGNQPDNLSGTQHCGSLIKEGALDDQQCSNLNSFFCEISV